jgi:hypothetical protein
MTFGVFEASTENGRPIEFYTFVLGVAVWRYTTAQTDQTVGADVYTAAVIVSPNVQQSGEPSTDALGIECPSWIAPAQLFMTSPPTAPIQVTISYKHIGDDQVVIGYTGEITQVNFPMPGKALITCESLGSSLSREGLRLGWQRSCPYALYDPVTCKVDKTAWKTDFVTLAISGFTIGVELATVRADGYYNGGFIEWIHPIRGIEYVMIDTHSAVPSPVLGEPNAFFLLFASPGELFEGAPGMAYPGCGFTPESCQGFSNYDNYGGAPDMPGKSPFDGNPVF